MFWQPFPHIWWGNKTETAILFVLFYSLCFFVLDDQKKLATIDDLVAKLDETSTFDKLAEKLEYSYRKTAVRWHSWIKY